MGTHLASFCPVHQPRQSLRGVLSGAHATLYGRKHVRSICNQHNSINSTETSAVARSRVRSGGRGEVRLDTHKHAAYPTPYACCKALVMYLI